MRPELNLCVYALVSKDETRRALFLYDSFGSAALPSLPQKQHRKKPSKKKSTGVLLGVGLSVLGMAGPQAAHITLWLGLFSGLAELPRGVGFVNPWL